ncbi:phage integrase N-terminal SAM-like domain-containing protein [Prosthecochloris sp. N3]|uniref:Phage integrase N-terminal SAM-like domain-containing protein n=1 Tax=Prosthecochloris ethylica TaxID=2743976 RepID=A0ABR9XPN2_9CHLB|nr:phage integrase N-terminal SAM-like domain-containing protein [Prosthecochloris ethylica]MBF0636001.1 phage integrase N-terminal SAM-like domain-containing protein [Prosthecochloris ethylica]NUK47323.1 phage integrase N-terminal SAM-like domain-containing protein [Prosthecochloris ethylica]
MPPDTETRTPSGIASREGQHDSPKILESLRHALYVQHYSNRTTDTYCSWIRRFVRVHNLRHPKEMGETEINAFLARLAIEEKVSSSTYHHDLLYPCVELQADWCPNPS